MQILYSLYFKLADAKKKSENKVITSVECVNLTCEENMASTINGNIVIKDHRTTPEFAMNKRTDFKLRLAFLWPIMLPALSNFCNFN